MIKNLIRLIFCILGFVGIVGNIDDTIVQCDGTLEGNGKTLTMIKYLACSAYYDHMQVITNIYTEIPDAKTMTVKEMVKYFNEGQLKNCIIGIDELTSTGLSSLGTKKVVLEFYNSLINQIRKGDNTGFYTQQRFKEVPKGIRERTKQIIMPEKYHKDDNTLCYFHKCERPHYIKVFLVRPFYKMLEILDCEKWGKLYNTKEVVHMEDLTDVIK